MESYKKWTYRGLTCMVQQETEATFLCSVKTPVHNHFCFFVLQNTGMEEAVSKTKLYADLIADIFDPINY